MMNFHFYLKMNNINQYHKIYEKITLKYTSFKFTNAYIIYLEADELTVDKSARKSQFMII